ncbi:MAG: hypothetical protein JOZ10_14620 [Acidobacteria bacterium]|nr:hypothetical protein [Acidobacteriota bacterium]MBV9435087.1 hypothetical protein [Acidobacteriota bacterium]
MSDKGFAPGMTSKATHGDVDIILRLYELRREPIMREARKFITFDYWPASFEELQKLFSAGGKEFAYFRQVTSYWDMAVSFVARGALDPALFLDNSTEMFFLYAKLKQFLPNLRETVNPQFFKRIEDFATGSPEAQQKLAAISRNVERVREQRLKTAAA